MKNIVAIVGRPNVGKSTLFNRIIEKKEAITNKQSGTTRDRNYGQAEWVGKQFTIVDTGGYMEDESDDKIFSNAVNQQVKEALGEASVILFMVDCSEGLVNADISFANLLREYSKKVILVANKGDNINKEIASYEFYKLSLGDVHIISSISGYGTGDLLDRIVDALEKVEDEEIKTKLPKIAILGRPNVGKSSLLNALLGKERTIVTPIAGTTRDAINTYYNLYNIECMLIDTAGIRRKAKVKEDVEFYSVMRSIGAIKQSDICLVVIDALQGIDSQDVNLITLAERQKKGIIILINKWDLIDKTQINTEEYKKELMSKLKFATYIPVVFISAVAKQRIYQALEKAMSVYQNRLQKVSTSTLNKLMLPIIERRPPPMLKGKHIKIKYVTQLPSATPAFVFFCNLPQYIRDPYKKYLEGQIRNAFNFEGVPIKLFFRNK
jgi:GTP-binding protein